MTLILFLVFFLAIFLSLIFVEVKDRKNNALLIYYFAISLWIAAGAGGVFSQVYTTVNPAKTTTKTSRKSTRTALGGLSVGHYSLILYGLLITSGVYVVRRPEWAGFIIDGLGALKGKDIDRVREMLVQHAISNPKDRRWVKAFLIDIETKRSKTIKEDPKDDIEIVPPDIIPK